MPTRTITLVVTVRSDDKPRSETVTELAAPAHTFRASFIAALEEFAPDENAIAYERDMATRDFDTYLEACAAMARGERLPLGWVPATTFWLVDGTDYIGTVNIRHELNDWLRRYGGHIGYAIRPSQRRLGNGTLICRLALDEARKLGLRRVLITCDDDNTGSRLIIERNGGVFDGAIPQGERPVLKRRYWIDL